MPNALLGAASCARCAAPVRPPQARCAACGVRLEGIAAGSALAARIGPLTGVVAAPGGRRRAAVLLDLVLVLLAGAAAAVATRIASRALTHDVELTALAAVAAVVLLLGALVLAIRSSGRTPGRALVRLRTVDTLSGLPPRGARSALAAVLTGHGRTVVTADLRAGRDPAVPRLEAVSTDQEALPAPQDVRAAAAAPAPVDAIAARLVLESGDEVLVDGPVLLGRAPEQTAAVRRVHALPDLSRGIARTHLLADWSNGLLWITDLGSPGGTTVRSADGAFQPLVPEVRTAVAPGWQIRLGGRTLTVRSVAVEEGVRGG
jgi:hypothetical protein